MLSSGAVDAGTRSRSTLKVVSSLPTAAIARVFLTTETTMSQRLLRAKRRIAEAGIPYRVPPPEALAERLDGVLAVVYLVFTEGYTTSDADVALEAIRLGRLVVDLMPDADEARALLALMLLQHSRRASARGRRGAGDARRAGPLAVGPRRDRRGPRPAQRRRVARRPYRIQADLAAVHATAPDAAATDWLRIVTFTTS